jgi:phospholipase C
VAGYTLTATALGTATAGKSASATVTLTAQNGYSGTVSLSCAVSGGGTPAPTCAIGTNPVSVGSAAASSTLTVSSTTSAPGGNYSVTVTARDSAGVAASNGPQILSLTMTAVIQHIVIIFQENRTPDNLFQDPVLIARGPTSRARA